MKIYDAGDKIIGIKIDTNLTKKDYQTLIPMIEERIGKVKKVKLFIQFEDFEGIEPGALWEDLKFDVKHRNDFDKIAIVGDKAWHKWSANFSKLFFNAEIKYFGADEIPTAWRWLGAREKLRQFDVNDDLDQESH